MTVFFVVIAVLLALGIGVLGLFLQMLFAPSSAASSGEASLGDPSRQSPGRSDRGSGSGKMRAVVACAGPAATPKTHQYMGLSDCRVAHTLYSGDRACKDACLGYGTCRDLCPLGAISLDADGLPSVGEDCDGCGLCAAECPSGAIQLVPREADFYVRCVSKADPASRASFCSSPCTACGVCQTAAEGAGFSIKDDLARISYRSKGDRTPAAEACPTGCIVPVKNAFQLSDNSLEWSDRESGAADASK